MSKHIHKPVEDRKVLVIEGDRYHQKLTKCSVCHLQLNKQVNEINPRGKSRVQSVR